MNEPTTCAQQGLCCDPQPVVQHVGNATRVNSYKCSVCGLETPADGEDPLQSFEERA